MAKISDAVGIGQKNNYADVLTVQILLNKNKKVTTPSDKLSEDGIIRPATIERIKKFQQDVVGLKNPDGIISPNGITMHNLVVHSSFHTSTDRATRSVIFSEAQLVEAAKNLGCEIAAIKAVVLTETPRGAFDEKGRPSILYERHYFHRLTNGKYDSDAVLSNKDAGGYGKYSVQYDKLNKAIALDKNAALQSASWGAFQIMGANFKAAGYANVEDFVKAMQTLQGQLDAFVSFIKNTPPLQNALQNKNWATFAKTYNGPKYLKNEYDTKLANNYQAALKSS
ncbi:N-acetylmuramidase domain-containing protein [Erwinia psidii]|uniref:N-acetylmuramidase family protein n=1 Tax=Erwinia psidii TaxID=69224 RepID=A0A3N6SAH3_9GAMM|nr:N-acetylmuramidase domain-containing protein [Erwinia psidii]MCX8959405.1 N-acetylmuramidase family protein [Erwinia psidii]MCX8962661.1 N-acetylmuramidase family protein [Erwinia psidii]MCX8964257.1 N-acetylmuramidase family protein [Erwinia psidii]RQM36933.1 N-acetylmuramidase family protein [Erwinia psidii]